MKEMAWIYLGIVIGILALFLVVYALIQRKDQSHTIQSLLQQNELRSAKEMAMLREQLGMEFGTLREKVNSELTSFQSQLSSGMRDDFHRLNESTTQRLGTIEEKVNRSMQTGFSSTYETFTKVMEQMARIDQTQKNLEGLSSQINALQSVLSDKKNRGTFGEIELYSLLEHQFGVNEARWQRQYRLANGKIADAVLFAPKPLGMIVIDSKFPLENFNRMYDQNLSKEEQERAKNQFRADVIMKIKDIASKYIQREETAEFAYMFIPAEAVFAELYGRFPDVISLSYEYHIYLVSPTTLMAYLTAMRAIYLGQERNEKLEQVQQEFIKLGKEFVRFEQRWDKINLDFKRTYNDIQDVNITTNKLVQRFKNVEAMKLEEDKESMDEKETRKNSEERDESSKVWD